MMDKEAGYRTRVRNRVGVIQNSKKNFFHPSVPQKGKDITLFCLWKYHIPELNRVYSEKADKYVSPFTKPKG